MPFLLMFVSYLRPKAAEADGDGACIEITTSTSLSNIQAARWQNGNVVSRLHMEGLEKYTSDKLSEVILPLLELADGCVPVTGTSPADIEKVGELCESVGYHLPIVDTLLDVSTLCTLFGLEDALPASLADAQSEGADQQLDAWSSLLFSLFAKTTALPQITLQHLSGLGHLASRALGTWFDEALEWRTVNRLPLVPEGCDVIDQLAFSKPGTEPSSEVDGGAETSFTIDVESPVNMLGADSPFAEVLPGFQVRPGQLQMVEAVSEALHGGHHLLVEAGTGTGKSLAYLIPAALHAQATDDRVIVSTHTIALQDQVSHRDFPILQQSLKSPVSLAVFKGRTHYICMRKLHQELRTVSLVTPPDEVLTYIQLVIWLTATKEGNREELTGKSLLGTVWPRVQSETETCISKRCPFFKSCYYFRARTKANNANVVVTNHSLVFTDLKANHHVLPHYNHVIFDEAHHLEQEATNHLGAEVSRFQCLSLIGRLSRDNGRHGVLPDLLQMLAGSDAKSVKAIPVLERLTDEIMNVRTLLEQAFASLSALVPQGQTDLRITVELSRSQNFTAVRVGATALEEETSVLEELAGRLSEFAETETDEDLSGRLFDAAGFLSELISRTRLLAGVGSANEDWVEWVEVSGGAERRQVVFHQAPIDVSKILKERLFETKDSVILTSATLSVAGDFSFLQQRLGLTSKSPKDDPAAFEVASLTVPSPFDYSRQALLCVPTDVPDLSKMSAEDASVWLSDSIYQLARISRGRLMTLFTSHAMLRATADYLRRPLAKQGLRLLAQGLDGSRTQILRMFQDEPQSVLLGAQSFWEGIDLPGDQLTTLCIVRLPFTPPTHPVTAARNELVEAQGKSAFWFNSLPEAVVRFRQGFGRLIRTVEDKGVVVVFDKRVVTARYGQQFIQSVPDLRTFHGTELEVLRTVKSFLA